MRRERDSRPRLLAASSVRVMVLLKRMLWNRPQPARIAEETVAMNRIAVAVFHGIGSQRPNFADALIGRLRANLAGRLRGTSTDAVVFRPIYWGHVLQQQEDWLFRQLRKVPRLRWRWLRRMVIEWLGDAIVYEPTPCDRGAYDAVHHCIADQLCELAGEAGDDTPLCVIAHSFGSVIANNYFHDLQATRDTQIVHERSRQSVLASGRSLAAFITVGSPIGLWAMRNPGFEGTLSLPAPELRRRFPALDGIWINLFAPNDVLAYPLSSINAAYSQMVVDVPIELSCPFAGWNPLSHFRYWTDENVVRSMSAILAHVSSDMALANSLSER
jgi:hypothetical protein